MTPLFRSCGYVLLSLTVTLTSSCKGPVIGEDYTIDLGGGVTMEFVWIGALNAWVGKYEVTNAEFRRFRPAHDSMDFRGQSLNGPRQPVVRVTYDEAVAFAEWLSGRQGLWGARVRARLLTCGEWTAIARCGTMRKYPWGNGMPPTRGNYADETAWRVFSGWTIIAGYDDGHAVSAPVEQSGRNDWGLYGVGGNVWEWTSERSGSGQVLRGAAWHSNLSEDLRVEPRRTAGPSGRNSGVGFRVVLSR